MFGLTLGAFGLVTLPLSNAFSRWREAMADAPAFVGAMEQLANQNLAEVEPEAWVEWLLYSHPPIGKRIARGQSFVEMKQARS